MREAFGDLWTFAAQPNAVACITTNGYVNGRGECVMGRGVALQAKKRFGREIATELGRLIKAHGNQVYQIGNKYGLFSFPTKHVWWRPSDLVLIEKSARELKDIAVLRPEWTFYLPRPGCANGGLRWEDVRPVLESVGLPDNVVVIDREENADVAG